MSVDKFGRTDANVVQRVVTCGGVTLTQANNIFLRRDGTSALDGDLHMNGKWIKGLPAIYPMPLGHGDEAISWAQAAALVRDVSVTGSGVVAEPTSDSHMTSKKYVNDLIKRITLVTGTPNMTSNETIINGLSYIASASDPPLGIEFRHEPWTAFQNCYAYPNNWTFEVPEDSRIQLKYPMPLSMKGFHIIPSSETYHGTITSWKVQASNDGIVFDHIVPHNTTPFVNGALHKFTFPASAKYEYWRFEIIYMNYTRQAGISMLRWIPTLSDIFLPRKCLVGYVPRLLSTTNYCAFEAITSAGVTVPALLRPGPRPDQGQVAVVRFIQPGFKAFKGDGSEFQWQPNRDMAPYWVSITYPTHVRIWKVGLRGRNRTTDRLYDWRLEGSNKGDVFQKIPETDQSYPVELGYFIRRARQSYC